MWPDLFGVVGAFLCLYALYQSQEYLDYATSWKFPALNLASSVFMGISLYYDFNLSSAITTIAWAAISLRSLIYHAQEKIGDIQARRINNDCDL